MNWLARTKTQTFSSWTSSDYNIKNIALIKSYDKDAHIVQRLFLFEKQENP